MSIEEVLGLLAAVIVINAVAYVRSRRRARRSRISTVAHQLEGPYRKGGQKRRK